MEFLSDRKPTGRPDPGPAALCAGHGIAVHLSPTTNCDAVRQDADSFWTLLYLTGYLTMAKNPSVCTGKARLGQSVLVIPNREIRDIFEQEAEAWLSKHRS